ncbi:NFX1-type zinc finger-containing protein 1-like isoform X2 [Physella acuta]|uniref:NFX1-type zinc finger-containing protein 1-like isoform X2 n=1 Tax=Physella acuta TaxID=109671 RepID=UPI0027DB475F|nr:NFX1-type zinc finger-containing protein 1-like isoform X2 [Physella acuta]
MFGGSRGGRSRPHHHGRGQSRPKTSSSPSAQNNVGGTGSRHSGNRSRGNHRWRSSLDVSGRSNTAVSGHAERRSSLSLPSGRDNQRGKETLSLKRLESWARTDDAGDLVLYMSSRESLLEEFLTRPSVEDDWLILLIKAINHALTAQHQKESIKKILQVLCQTRFLEQHLVHLLTNRQIQGNTWTEAKEVFSAFVNIINEIIDKLPEYANKCTAATIQLSSFARAFFTAEDEVLQVIKTLEEKGNNVRKSLKEKEARKSKAGQFGADDHEQPPEDFMSLSVIPEAADLKEDAHPFLRRAITKGVYEDACHYLDIQFRLMRQDFILPLRQGINEFIYNGCKKDYRCSDLRLYFDVHITGIVYKDGIDHILQFDVSKMKGVRWEFSKRLIFGSLVCLSKDNFQTVIFATVAHRDVKQLAKGIVTVNIKSGHDVAFNSTSRNVFIMAETTAYYESYCHVLEGLQEMSSNLPLQDYIIKCNKDVKPPKYLLSSDGILKVPYYDLSCLLVKNTFNFSFPVLTTVKWPPTYEMCLNESQRLAAIAALTKEIAVIQGPPGTGKTYVGLKVMEVLLENKTVMTEKKGNEPDPILVVCYTNHALDQFLEGVLEFCEEGIIRVGGKSSSEKLEKFNIKNIKQEVRKGKQFANQSVRHSKYQCMKTLKEVSNQIQGLIKTMNNLETSVEHEDVLQQFMKPEHYRSLCRENAQRIPNTILWLNASKNTPQTAIPKMIKQHLMKQVLRWPMQAENLQIENYMNVVKRASLYTTWLTQYRMTLYKEMLYLSQMPNFFTQGQIMNLDRMFQLSFVSIIPDQLLQWVLPELLTNSVFERISGMIRERKKEFPDRLVECWLLGLHRELDDQLDDIAMLATHLTGEDVDVFDDTEASKQVEEERMIDDGDDDSDEEDVNYESKLKLAKSNLASVIQRVEMMGLKEDITNEDEDETAGAWNLVQNKKSLSHGKIRKKLFSIKPMTDIEESNVDDVWTLDLNKRFSLYNLWVQKYKLTLTEKMEQNVKMYTEKYRMKQEINREETLFILKRAKVIGMTTTGAAKHRAVIQSLGCRIIVVEEAAEVLESHIVTALNKQCNHLILIGDHQQLRPNPTVYQLARDFGLEISLFERLIKNNVPHVVLKEQHRMRPEISTIMKHIYPALEDHASVSLYDHVRGVEKDIFFINHKAKEARVEDTKSKANTHEAKFAVALCRYFLLQGYEPTQITILATYTGQVFEIKKIMRASKFDEHVRVTAVDNYQGEENEIIILSLVRSNDNSSVGFLKVDNRVCVALSRAKKGLFVIGNFELLASQSKLWTKIVDTAKRNQIFGEGLPVCCQNHPDFKVLIFSEKDFEQCPGGGCGKPCDFRMACGHSCGQKCHGTDPEHKTYKCFKPCSKSCPAGHPCKKKCFQPCKDCTFLVPKEIPSCGHVNNVECHLDASKALCSHPCEEILDCEHPCSGTCGRCKSDKKHQECRVPKECMWPCGHVSRIPCNKNPSSITCPKQCGAQLSCGHTCKGTCSNCLEGLIHVACEEKCDQILPCGHQCASLCGIPCLPCNKQCKTRCPHGSCKASKQPQPCGLACAPCKEQCKYTCQHESCTKMCSELCAGQPCKEKCTKKVHNCQQKKGDKQACKNKLHSCTHKCSSLCGELCACNICEKVSSIPGISKHVSDQSEDTSDSNQPIKRLILKIPGCLHIFYVDELDEYIQSFDPDGTQYLACPVCSTSITACRHYKNDIKDRQLKREIIKTKLLKENKITENDIRMFEKSQRIIGDSIFVHGFRQIKIDAKQNKSELLAASFKIKFAYVLGEIKTQNDKYNCSTHDGDKTLRNIKDALFKVKYGVTKQQADDFTLELLRQFATAYLSWLLQISSWELMQLSDDILIQMKESKEILKLHKPHREDLDQVLGFIQKLNKLVMASATTRLHDCSHLENLCKQMTLILQSQKEEMLSDLLYPESSELSNLTQNQDLFDFDMEDSDPDDDLHEQNPTGPGRLSSKLNTQPLENLAKLTAAANVPSLADWGKMLKK